MRNSGGRQPEVLQTANLALPTDTQCQTTFCKTAAQLDNFAAHNSSLIAVFNPDWVPNMRALKVGCDRELGCSGVWEFIGTIVAGFDLSNLSLDVWTIKEACYRVFRGLKFHWGSSRRVSPPNWPANVWMPEDGCLGVFRG